MDEYPRLTNNCSKMERRTTILNVSIHSIKKDELLSRLKSGVVFTPNVDHLIKLQRDKDFYETYKKADWILCDSRILFLFSKLLKTPILETIAGSSLFPAFYNYHKENTDIKIFLLGAASGVAAQAMRQINEKVGREIVVGAHSPTYGFENDDEECSGIVEMINTSDANVLLVGLGAPKQENWIVKYKDKLANIKIFFALGATIDFEAGNISRAPMTLQRLGLEWLYRLVNEPKRLWRRYLVEDISFFYYFLLQLLGKYKDPFS